MKWVSWACRLPKHTCLTYILLAVMTLIFCAFEPQTASNYLWHVCVSVRARVLANTAFNATACHLEFRTRDFTTVWIGKEIYKFEQLFRFSWCKMKNLCKFFGGFSVNESWMRDLIQFCTFTTNLIPQKKHTHTHIIW